MVVDAQVSSMNTRRSGSRRADPRTKPRADASRRACPARPRAPSFFARDLVATAEAPERGHADLGTLAGKPRLQLRQGQIGHVIQRRADQVGMRLCLAREPVAALRLGSRITSRAARCLPAD